MPMSADAKVDTPANPAWMRWSGRILSVLVSAALAMSGVMKFMSSEQMTKGFEHLGWPLALAPRLGIIELTCVVFYLIPQTAVLGAILITGYMGGAIATHMRIEEAVYFQIAIGVLAWVGVYLREPRLRAILPLRKM